MFQHWKKVIIKNGRHSKKKPAETPTVAGLKNTQLRTVQLYNLVYWNRREKERGWYKVSCTETGEKKSVDDIQFCILKQERN